MTTDDNFCFFEMHICSSSANSRIEGRRTKEKSSRYILKHLYKNIRYFKKNLKIFFVFLLLLLPIFMYF